MDQTFLPLLNSTGGDFNILGFVASPFTAILGDYFWLLFGLIPTMMIFIKSQDVAIPVIVGILFTAAFGMALPENLGVALLMLLGTGAGVLIYRVFKTGAE